MVATVCPAQRQARLYRPLVLTAERLYSGAWQPRTLLDRAGIEEAFRRLGDRLARRGVVADLYVFGGAAMALAYDSRRTTRDVDALFKPMASSLRKHWPWPPSLAGLGGG
jgi:hypothetical protein